MAKKKKKPAASEDIVIEAAMQELEEIVSDLESGQTTLADSLQQFERGMVLLRSCHRQLDSAAQRIEHLSSVNEDGQVTTTAFDGSATAAKQVESNADDDEASTLF